MEYATLVRAYRSGGPAGPDDVVPAVSALALWPVSEIAQIAASAQSTFSVGDLIAAAALHTETANAIADRASADADFHIKTAGDLLMAARHQDAARADIVRRQWYVFVVGLYEAEQRVPDAVRLVHDGFEQFPHAAELYVARATVIEANMRRIVPDLRRDLPLEPRTRSRVEDAFKAVVSNGQQALDRDHALPAAYLHIGWARLMMHDRRGSMRSNGPSSTPTTTGSATLLICFSEAPMNSRTGSKTRAASMEAQSRAVRIRVRTSRSVASRTRSVTQTVPGNSR